MAQGQRLLLGILSAIFLCHCGRINKTMDDTSHLSEKSDELGQSSHHLDLVTNDLYNDARQKETLTVRLVNLLNYMDQAKTLEAKMAVAGTYLEAFEFQKWQPGIDSEQRRLVLFNEAVQEFFMTLTNFISDRSYQDVSPASTKAINLDLYAIAATLDQVNSLQIQAAKISPFKVYSMLDLIENALTSIHQKQADPSMTLPDYAQSISANLYGEAVYLLQVRENVLLAAPLDKISQINTNKGFLGLSGKIRGMMMCFSSWNATLQPGFDADSIDFAAQNLVDARKLREFLVSAGITPKIDSELADVYRHMKFDTAKLASQDPSTSAAGHTAFASAVTRLVNEISVVNDELTTP